MKRYNLLRDHSFSTFANFLKKLILFNPWYAHVHVYQGVRNVCFSENFANVLNEGSLNYLTSKKKYRYAPEKLYILDFAFQKTMEICKNIPHQTESDERSTDSLSRLREILVRQIKVCTFSPKEIWLTLLN